ncbi:hypothetical protein CC1G_14006 [Coprinopsis cinerea okayama7|uniref:Uncharacterized protein n=1 Tax=Coprinopsis cinerea (strain Okayama-7 / 130 / ATCC MYA-4618 / FGSC 9003) TaxID=240176 RepID=D6RKT0_COPC7|nr:hypothetical protein CC1G_14006 [Coprinopsis cinerea okayama7\|eukprot:XP_002911967.1 hypothetical protein CC1G_14006 [Coprinopsis cinerea okayama7\
MCFAICPRNSRTPVSYDLVVREKWYRDATVILSIHQNETLLTGGVYFKRALDTNEQEAFLQKFHGMFETQWSPNDSPFHNKRKEIRRVRSFEVRDSPMPPDTILARRLYWAAATFRGHLETSWDWRDMLQSNFEEWKREMVRKLCFTI